MLPTPEEVRRAAAKSRGARGEGAPVQKRAIAKAVKRKAGNEATAAEAKRPRPSSPTRSPSPTPADRPQKGAEIDLTLDSPSERREADIQLSPPAPPVGGEAPVEPPSECFPVEEVRSGVPPRVTGESSDPLAAVGAGNPPTSGAVPPAAESTDVSFRALLEREGRWAERLVSGLCLPELQGALQEQRTSTFFREAFVAHVWAANSLMALKDVLAQASSSLGRSQEENRQANLRVDQAEKAAEAALARSAEEEAKARRAEEALAESRAEVEKYKRTLESAVAERLAAEESRDQLELEVRIRRSSLETANLLKHAAEERAECAEELSRNLDAQLAELKASVVVAEVAATEAMEAAAAKAVEDFRQSAGYREELADATSYAYDLGFQDCKDRARKICNLDLNDLNPNEPEGLSPEDPPSSCP